MGEQTDELVVLIGRLRRMLPDTHNATTRWADSVLAGSGVPVADPEVERVRREVDALKAELADAAAAAAAEPVCEDCGLGRGYAHHFDRNAKGYHPFWPPADPVADPEPQTCGRCKGTGREPSPTGMAQIGAPSCLACGGSKVQP